MPTFTREEAQEQALKAARYFGRVLAEDPTASFLVANVGGVTFVAATGEPGAKLEEALVGGLLGKPATIQQPKGADAVVLIPRYHVPGGEFANRQGHVHLHVLNAVKLGRRVRKSGECLCSKKHGSDEQAPQGQTSMCPECVKVADEYRLTWSLD